MRTNGGTRSATPLPLRPDLVLPYGISLKRTVNTPREVCTSMELSSVSPVSDTTTPFDENGRGATVVGWNRAVGETGPGVGVAAAPKTRMRRDFIFQRLPGCMASPASKRHGSTAVIVAPRATTPPDQSVSS